MNACTYQVKDHIRRLTVQEHEVDRTLLKAMVTDTTLPLDMRLQVRTKSEMAKAQVPKRVCGVAKACID